MTRDWKKTAKEELLNINSLSNVRNIKSRKTR
jgi:hypothetical protein